MGGCKLNLVRLDKEPGTLEHLGFVLATPNTAREFTYGYDPADPLNTFATDERFEKIIFAEGDEVKDLPPAAFTISMAQTVLGRSRDAYGTLGCPFTSSGVPVKVLTKDGKVVEYVDATSQERTFFAIPIGGWLNLEEGYEDSRWIFKDMWIAPTEAARKLKKDNTTKFDKFFGAALKSAAAYSQLVQATISATGLTDYRKRMAAHIAKIKDYNP